jgi:hypothetical protein
MTCLDEFARSKLLAQEIIKVGGLPMLYNAIEMHHCLKTSKEVMMSLLEILYSLVLTSVNSSEYENVNFIKGLSLLLENRADYNGSILKIVLRIMYRLITEQKLMDKIFQSNCVHLLMSILEENKTIDSNCDVLSIFGKVCFFMFLYYFFF